MAFQVIKLTYLLTYLFPNGINFRWPWKPKVQNRFTLVIINQL